MIPGLLSPLALAVLAAVLCGATIRRRDHDPDRDDRRTRLARAVRALGLALGVASLAAMTPLVANLQVRWIEQSVPPPAPGCDAPWQDIVVLTGGFDRAPADDEDVAALTPDTWRRVIAAAALQRAHPQAQLLVVGGNGPPAESRVAAVLARHLGVPETALRREERSGNTLDNARAVAALEPRPATPVHLVTSGLHLRRATLAFRAAGLATCPHAADSSYVAPTWPGALWPQSTSLAKTEAAWHELAGAWRLP